MLEIELLLHSKRKLTKQAGLKIERNVNFRNDLLRALLLVGISVTSLLNIVKLAGIEPTFLR